MNSIHIVQTLHRLQVKEKVKHVSFNIQCFSYLNVIKMRSLFINYNVHYFDNEQIFTFITLACFEDFTILNNVLLR